ncbi:type I-E CRISPR-associated protein Cse2/CasB [Crossiella equi]|uniref:type I-E CRISPR-associated protein Cse2/CasB n=1 Tax=Crossiella equi TaxID=130796 RepID=UPI0020114A53|nr:type I-E CRISPR-associated protein Cse2/CasB [Crossiella equi]
MHGIERALNSGIQKRVAGARHDLALLRRSLTGGRQAEAYEVVFRDAMPDRSQEQEVWVLVGGLFALHPSPWRDAGRIRSIGASMGLLSKKAPNAATVTRRFTQLLGRSPAALPYDLRQAVRLLADHGVPVHYGRLLDDLVVLLGKEPRGERASEVRLTWAREYHLPRTATTTTEPAEPGSTALENTP